MNTQAIFIGVYQYYNASIRILRPLIDKIEGVDAHTIFYKKYIANIYNAPTVKEEEIFIDLIKRINPKIVGISLLSPYVEIAKRLTDLIKKNSTALVVWGGVGPTILPEEHIKYADIICIGEGEQPLQELARAVRDGKDYKNIKNLWIKDGGKIIKNPKGPLIQELDALPFCEWGHENMYFIEQNKLLREDPEVENSEFYIQTSRGCPYSCNFCVETMYHDIYKGLGKFVRRRSVDSIIQELKLQFSKTNNKKKFIFFIDEVFGSNAPWIDEFAPRYKKEIGIPFFVKYHPKTLKPRIIDRLVEAGISGIGFGIQTGSDYIRNKIYERPGTNAEVISLSHELAKHKHIEVLYDLILDNDFETKETLKECINLILQLPKPVNFNLFSLKHFPDYGLTKKAIDAGHVTPEEVGNWHDQMISTTEEWKFMPRWKKRKKTRTKQLQRLNNIIFLMCGNNVKDSVVKYAIFGNSPGSKIVLHYLNIKACLTGQLFGKITQFGKGKYYWRWSYFLYKRSLTSYPLAAIKLILKGELKELMFRIKKIMKRTFLNDTKKSWYAKPPT